MKFTKMHGLGNDYLYYYGTLDNVETLSVQLSNRHFGIGSDGIITISNSDVADFKMRIFNADGSEAKMCGNGIRCVGKYVYDNGYTTKTRLHIETLSGIKTLNLHIENNVVSSVDVDMGTVRVCSPERIQVYAQDIEYMPVSVGNPHAVVFVEDVGLVDVAKLGSTIEKHPNFEDGVNVEFVQKLGHNHLRMRVWERGSGITMACGTGACASASAAVAKGLCDFDTPIQVDLDGGALRIQVRNDYEVQMCGPATKVCECEVA